MTQLRGAGAEIDPAPAQVVESAGNPGAGHLAPRLDVAAGHEPAIAIVRNCLRWLGRSRMLDIGQRVRARFVIHGLGQRLPLPSVPPPAAVGTDQAHCELSLLRWVGNAAAVL